MNGPSKLSLAIALALIGGNAFALGLGSIQVKSGLNQPLDAEIAVTTEAPGEAAGINVSMATAEDFDRVGLNRSRVNVPIDFAVSTNNRGQAVIKLTTKEAVREPFLDFLVQVNWPKGKLLREYTVLLDPPVTAPAVRGAPATVTPAKEHAAAPAQKLAVEEKPTKSKATTVKPPKSAASEPKQPAASKPAPAPKSTPASAPTRTAAAGDYGPVAEGETLSEVARATRPDEAANINQMMLALLKANPNAFYKDNINALKRGAILRIPSGDELKANGNAAAAAAAVREQNDAWGSGAAVAKPTVVANAGAPKSAPAPKAETKSSGKPSEHLALLPPRAGKESQASADHPGPSSGTGAGADTKAELARTKEALASREQEATELKSRVKQLEDLNGKDQRLLSLKESEIAELQAKLKELQSKAATTAATAATKPTTTTPATTPATTTPSTTASTASKPADTTASTKPADAGTKGEPKLTAQDIWGNIAATEKAGATKPSTTGTTTPTSTPSTTATPSSSTTPPATAGSATPPATSASTTSPTTPSTTSPSTTGATTPPATTSTSSSTAPSTTGSTTPSSTTSPNGTTVTPVTTPSTSAPTSLTSTTPTTTPPKAITPAAPKPVTPAPTTDQPAWYQNNTVLLAGGVGLLLIGLLTLMRFMRKPKPVLMPVEGGADLEEQAMHTGDEEHHLLDALAQSPGDAHLSLELLNLYYSQRDAAKFEAAAEAMYAHIADPTQHEWQQVKAMGEEICPHNPLFSRDVGLGGGGRQEHTVFGHYDADTAAAQDDVFDLGGHDGHDAKHAAAEDNFDFDLTDHAAAPAAAPAYETAVAHELPPAPVATRAAVHAPAPPVHVPAPAAVPASKPAEDFFAGEDAIGTKLDLAKAYLDMGDPEGARSMLDEVMSEGNDAQKGEARKLLAEIR